MPSFWKKVVYILKVMAHFVKVLLLVGNERKLVMGYATNHFLNLELFYDNPQMKINSEVIRRLFACINKWVGNLECLTQFLCLCSSIVSTIWLINFQFAKTSCNCSASDCKHNWSIFEQIHTVKRNRLKHKRLHDFVYVKYSQALKLRYNLKDEVDPISLNDIYDCNEWLIGEMDGDNDES
ncbi:hypothetical protein CR513_29548, partial [Mucuna pruriens]